MTATVTYDPSRLARAIAAQATPSEVEISRIRDRAEQEIRTAYGTEVSKFAAAAATAVLASSPFVVAAVLVAAPAAAVGVSVVVAGPVLAAAVRAARAVTEETDVDERDFATMTRTLREMVVDELIREAQISVHNALVETRGQSELKQAFAVREALDPKDPRWRSHIERTAATLATAAVAEGVAIGAARAQRRTGRHLALRWRTRGDAKVRASHRIANGQVRAVGMKFDIGQAMLRWPGDPLGPPDEVVHCRCLLVPTRAR